MVDAVYKSDDIYSGAFVGNAAELQVGLRRGLPRVVADPTSAARRPGIVYPNMKKWSGDHGAYDYKTTPGTLISEPPARRAPLGIMISPRRC